MSQEQVDEITARVDAVQRHPGPAHAGAKSRFPLAHAVPEPGAEPRIG